MPTNRQQNSSSTVLQGGEVKQGIDATAICTKSKGEKSIPQRCVQSEISLSAILYNKHNPPVGKTKQSGISDDVATWDDDEKSSQSQRQISQKRPIFSLTLCSLHNDHILSALHNKKKGKANKDVFGSRLYLLANILDDIKAKCLAWTCWWC